LIPYPFIYQTGQWDTGAEGYDWTDEIPAEKDGGLRFDTDGIESSIWFSKWVEFTLPDGVYPLNTPIHGTFHFLVGDKQVHDIGFKVNPRHPNHNWGGWEIDASSWLSGTIFSVAYLGQTQLGQQWVSTFLIAFLGTIVSASDLKFKFRFAARAEIANFYKDIDVDFVATLSFDYQAIGARFYPGPPRTRDAVTSIPRPFPPPEG